MRAAVIAAALAVAPCALADEGELFLSASAEVEAAWLRHPLASPFLGFDDQTAFTFLPRLTVGARFGVSNELHLGIGIGGAGVPNIVTNDVALRGVRGQLVTGGFFEGTLPLSLSWRFDSGCDVSGVVRFDVMPSLSLWTANALADSRKLDATGRPARLPFDVPDALGVGASAQLSFGLEWRVFEHVVLGAAPFVGVGWTGSPEVSVGIRVEPLLVERPGPP
jgi:hypothetical protein